MTDRDGSEREAVIARLGARLGGRFTEDDIAHAVHAAFDDLIAHAKFQAYLPVLAERSASARLAQGARRASLTVELRGAAKPWRDDLEALSAGRWQVVARDADIVVVTPDDPWSSDEIVLVADRRHEAPPEDILRAYEAGATGYVCAADPAMIRAHLDAITRRASPPT